MDPPHDLDAVVTAAAAKLMAATVGTTVEISREVLADLVAHLEVDVSFLRYNDHDIGASRLVAEWPPRPVVPEPDPLAVVYFDDDPVFAQCEHAKTPAVFAPEPANADYQQLLVEAGSSVPASSLAAVPLVSGDVTTGTLGFVKFGDREWRREELNALQAIASLFAQVQARIVAEEQLRYLAHHDELTGLHNRRGLLAHLSDRRRQHERVVVLFLDLDRLKNVNDDLGHAAGDDVIRATAGRLRQALHHDDVLARLGGDEFVASLITPIDEAELGALTERVHACLAEPVQIGATRLSIGASIGVVIAGPDDPRDPVQILRDADTAMYAAKNNGGGRTHYVARADDYRSPAEPAADDREIGRLAESSAEIHQAIGVLRAQTGVGTDDALRMLERTSDDDGTELSEVARRVLERAVERARSTAAPNL